MLAFVWRKDLVARLTHLHHAGGHTLEPLRNVRRIDLIVRYRKYIFRATARGRPAEWKLHSIYVAIVREFDGVFSTRCGNAPEFMEFRLLQFFIENRGTVHSRDDLLDAVWGYDAMPTTRTVDVHIAWLRQKLEENPRHPQYIQTVHGMGYKFVT